MKKLAVVVTVAGLGMAASQAHACDTLDEAMANFEDVKNAYVAAAPNLKPEQFQVWAKHIQAFGDSMGKQDYPKACETLTTAALELGLTGSAVEDDAVPPPPDDDNLPPPPDDNDTLPPPPDSDTANAGGWKECPRGRCRD